MEVDSRRPSPQLLSMTGPDATSRLHHSPKNLFPRPLSLSSISLVSSCFLSSIRLGSFRCACLTVSWKEGGVVGKVARVL